MAANTSVIDLSTTGAEEAIKNTFFDVSYKGDETKQKVAKILNIPSSKGWEVVDAYKNLVLVHYVKDEGEDIFGWLRGWLVDLKTKEVVAKSFGYTPTAISSTLSETEGSVKVEDVSGKVHSFNSSEMIIKRAYEGVVFRMIWYDGEMLSITHKRIRTEKSRWGSSKTFLTMYKEAGGPTAEQLFDTTKKYSSDYYIFLIVDPSLLVASKQIVKVPYIVHLSTCKSQIIQEDIAPGCPSFETKAVDNFEVKESFILSPSSLNISEANHFLNFGHFKELECQDPRFLPGEGVLIYKMEGDNVIDIVKVHSPAYEWRISMRGNNPNIKNQFFHLLGIAYRNIQTEYDFKDLTSRLVILPLQFFDIQMLKSQYEKTNMLFTVSKMNFLIDTNFLRSKDARIHLLWVNYLFSLPFNHQKEALTFLEDFFHDRSGVTNWLSQLEFKNKNIDILDIPDRAKGIIKISRSLAQGKISKGQNYNNKGQRISLPFLIKSTIRNLIYKEDGPSIYRLIKAMKTPPKA